MSAQDTKFSRLCVRWRSPAEPGNSTCGISHLLPDAGRAIEVYDWGVGSSRHSRDFSAVFGLLRSDVASVQVYFHRGGKRRMARAISGQVSAEDAAELHEPSPFGGFLAVARGCVPPRQFRAIALAADGQILGADRGFYLSYGPCAKGATATLSTHRRWTQSRPTSR
jgi:hypothetical protein